ncbi:MAG: hypothetical protein ACOCRO_02215 [Halanaerobiales bacterium]
MGKVIDEDFVRQEFKQGKIRKKLFPMLTDYGIIDYSENVHSHGLNYITAIGREINGIAAVSECPIYNQDKTLREVRPDSIWFNKSNNQPLLIAEFERYDNTASKLKKLKEKIENLLIGYHQLGSRLEYILFVYWTYEGVTPGNIYNFTSMLDKGFTLPNGRYISGIDSLQTDYMIYQAIAAGDRSNLKINRWMQVR